MKKLASKILLLLLLLAVEYAGLEAVARALYPEASLRLAAKDVLLAQRAETIEVLLMGNSHAARGIDPADLSRPAFNLAFPATDLYNCRHLLARVVDRLPRLRTIIVNLSDHSFAFDAATQTPALVYQFWEVYRIPPRSSSLVTPLRYAQYLSRFWLVRGTFLKDFIRHGLRRRPPRDPILAVETLHDDGFRTTSLSLPPAVMRQHAAKRVTRHIEFGTDESARERNRDYLRDFLTLAAEHRLDVVIVTLPLSTSYRELYPRELSSQFDDDLHQVLADLPDVRYLDFGSTPGLTNDDFKDADHLNGRGAAKVTRLLDVALFGDSELE
ncbi:MAG: hypothetical protein P9L99_14515 [Candidatus Lernaella stagnicola]|nr:hypothetical protein [Candidatus Lernaella stagnicola]